MFFGFPHAMGSNFPTYVRDDPMLKSEGSNREKGGRANLEERSPLTSWDTSLTPRPQENAPGSFMQSTTDMSSGVINSVC